MNMESNSYFLKDADINDMQLFFESYIGYTNSQMNIEAFSSLYELFDSTIHVDIAHLYIAPKYRKLNAADNLYEFIVAQCRVLKATKISVSCGINSTLNQRFYTRRKFIYIKKMFMKHIEN